jgi:plastocyanin
MFFIAHRIKTKPALTNDAYLARMRASAALMTFIVLFVTGTCTEAATFIADLKDASGRPAANAVVSLESGSSGEVTSHLPERAIIDQRHEMFIPLVVVVRKEGQVVFTNNDTTKHQVYSFSAIKQFQFIVSQGETSQPVEFPQSGIAAIGCNIHDQMIAYAFVGQMAYAAVTDDSGRVTISDVNPGRYRLAVWHPQMGVSPPTTRVEVDVKQSGLHYSAGLPITIETPRGMKHMHMDY